MDNSDAKQADLQAQHFENFKTTSTDRRENKMGQGILCIVMTRWQFAKVVSSPLGTKGELRKSAFIPR